MVTELSMVETSMTLASTSGTTKSGEVSTLCVGLGHISGLPPVVSIRRLVILFDSVFTPRLYKDGRNKQIYMYMFGDYKQ